MKPQDMPGPLFAGQAETNLECTAFQMVMGGGHIPSKVVKNKLRKQAEMALTAVKKYTDKGHMVKVYLVVADLDEKKSLSSVHSVG